MIKSIRLKKASETLFECRIGDANPSHGMIVKNIDGLNPAKANVNITDISTTDGGIYNSSRLDKRNIVITFLLAITDGCTSIENARLNSYKYFPIKKLVDFEVETDNRIAHIEGYVESNEISIFSKEEEVKVSIVCPFPYFYSSDGTATYSFSGLTSSFSFPFLNPVNESTLVFGVLSRIYESNFDYFGDSRVGVTITAYAIGEVTNPSFYLANTGQTINIDTSKFPDGHMILGDTLIINTMSGQKSAYVRRNNVNINVLNSLDRYTDWMLLEQGTNLFGYTADSGASNLMVTLRNEVLYEGV